jgi:hypothetical protein
MTTRVELLRAQLRDAHRVLEATIQDVTPELFATPAPGVANSVGERYGHLATAEDNLIHVVLQGKPPLMSSTWEGRTGISEPRFGTDPEHARRVRTDLAAVRKYAGAVYAAADAYLASLGDADLEREIDLSAFGFGRVKAWWVVSRLVVGHVDQVSGEIAAIKGALGVRGFPF